MLVDPLCETDGIQHCITFFTIKSCQLNKPVNVLLCELDGCENTRNSVLITIIDYYNI